MKIFETTEDGKPNQYNSLVSLDSDYGKLLFIGNADLFEDKDWDQVKKLGFLYLMVEFPENTSDFPLTIEFAIDDKARVPLGSIFTTSITSTV